MSSCHLTLTVLLTGLALSYPAFAQRGPSTIDPSDLPDRMLGSEMIVIGTVRQYDPVLLRKTSDPREAQSNTSPAELNLSTDIVLGTLITAEIDQVLCEKDNYSTRTTDARPGGPLSAGDTVHVFFPHGELLPIMDGNDNPETLAMSHQYLLLLERDRNTEANLAKYELDPKMTYFRAVQKGLGAFQLTTFTDYDRQLLSSRGIQPDANSVDWREARAARGRDVASRVTALCAAVQPASVFQRIDRLEVLITIGDEQMKKDAQKLIDVLAQAEGR